MTDTHPSKDYTARDRDFMRACRRVIAESSDPNLTIAKVTARAARMRAPSYYVEYSYAMRKLNALAARRHTLDSKTVCSRWTEIQARVAALMERRALSRNEALARVLREGGASSFFLAPRSAARLYLRLRHGRRAGGRPERHSPACR